METRKEMTRHLIASSFKEQMLRHPFDKISIKMIVDGADIRRPSFYNHFLDKYDLLEWIVADEVIRPAQEILTAGHVEEAWETLFSGLRKDADFYRKAFTVIGQNGFEESFVRHLQPLMEDFLSRANSGTPFPSFISEAEVARYHAMCFSVATRIWLESERDAEPRALVNMYRYLMTRSLFRDPEN